MKKIKSPKKGFIKYLALVPAIIIALGLFTAASAQQKAIYGKVVFEDGSPAPGTSIVVVGSTLGTVADLDGAFSLYLEGNPELAVSFVGFKTVRIFANELAKKNVVLYPKAYKMDLDDVEATDQKKKKVEYKAEKLTVQTKKEKDLDKLTIRTDGSLENQPVYVVDGKKIEEIKSLDPDQIQEISIIKDSDSPISKKYKAEHGVVVITMKEKRKEKTDPDQEIFFIVEEMPSFPGGKEQLKGYIYENLVYPAKAKKKGLSGEVYVRFTIDTKGDSKDIEVVKSSNDIFNKAAMNVFKDMPAWNPGKQRGKAVSIQFVVPVKFNADQE